MAFLTMEVLERHARTRAITRDTVSPANSPVAGVVDASRDVARVVSDVSVLCPRAAATSDNVRGLRPIAIAPGQLRGTQHVFEARLFGEAVGGPGGQRILTRPWRISGRSLGARIGAHRSACCLRISAARRARKLRRPRIR
jgi:hypothetical protein